MAILSKLVHEAFASHEGVVAAARAQLEGELKAVATGPYELRLITLADLVQSGEALNRSLASIFGGGRLRVDRVLTGTVPTERGALEIAIPFSGKDTLAPQFSMAIEVGSPSGAMLTRSAMGSWGFGNWVALPGFEDHPQTRSLCEALEKSNASTDMEWDFELPARYVIKLPWTMQLVPVTNTRSRLVMQSGRQGIFLRRFGVDVFFRKVDQLKAILAATTLPAASEGVAQTCWYDLVSRLPAQAFAPAAAPGGLSAPRPPAKVVSSDESKVFSRATWAVVLSALSLPLACFPLGLVGGGLALSSRGLASKLGVNPPGRTIAALVMGGLSTAFFILVMVAGALAPKTKAGADAATVRADASADADDTDADANADDERALAVQVPLGGNGEEPPGLPFKISKVYEKQAPSLKAPFHISGGDWTYFDALIENDPDCAFTVGVAPSKSAGGFGFGKVQLSVKDRASASCVVERLADGLGTDAPEEKAGKAKAQGPLELSTAVLGDQVARAKGGGFGGKGSWTATKLFLEKGDTYGEVFFNFDLRSKQGEFSQKDEEYDHDVVALLAMGLRDGPPKGKAPKGKHR